MEQVKKLTCKQISFSILLSPVLNSDKHSAEIALLSEKILKTSAIPVRS